ncbi:MAG: PAS domain S-box protein [bacterium]|nr:PAS domain S-box protein [bacterium]
MTAGKDKNILLVEDEAITAMVEQKELEKYGYQVIHVLTGEEAIETVLVKKTEVDLILMDIDLGSGIDGTEAAEKILAEKDIPVVFLSSHTEPEIVEKTEKITSYGYVVKNSGITILDASMKMAFKLFEAKVKERVKEKALQQSEQAQKKSEGRLRNLIEQSPLSIQIFDIDGRTVQVNKAWEKLWGTSWEEFDKLEYNILKDEQAIKLGLVPYMEKAYSGEVVSIPAMEYDARDTSKKGNKRWAKTRVYPTMDESGNILNVVAIQEDITRHKQAEEKLHESEEKYRILVENQTDMIVKFDKEGTLLFVSPSYCKTFGKTPEELTGTKFMPLIHEDDREEVAKAIEKVYHPPYTCHVEERAMTKDGWRWQAWFNTAILDKNNKIVSIVAAGRDITGQKMAENALMEKQSVLESNVKYFESMNIISKSLSQSIKVEEIIKKAVKDVFNIFDSDRAWLLYPCDVDADAFQVLFEYTKPEYPGALESGKDQHLDEETKQVFRDALSAHGVITYDLSSETFRNCEPVKNFYMLSQMIVVLRPKIGSPWIFGMHQCSHERIWTEEEKELFNDISLRVSDTINNLLLFDALKESEERLVLALDASNSGIWDFNPYTFTDTDTHYSDRWFTMLGYEPHELPHTTETWTNLIHPEDLEQVQRKLKEHINGKNEYSAEFRMKTKSGAYCLIHSIGKIVSWDDDGHPERMIGIHSDITERKKVEEELEKSLTEKSILFSELQHRIKNNFTMICSMISLAGDYTKSEEVKSAMTEIESRIKAITEMYTLLNTQKDESANEVQIDEYLSKVIASLPVPGANITLTITLEPVKLPVKTAIVLGITTTELVTNSIKYAFPENRGGSIKISFKKTGTSATLTVHDNGIGLPHGFDISSVQSMGLTLVKALVSQLNGNIKIESDNGTHTVINFPFK